jgi:NADH:ubiquinone oxidoreductase subunit
MSILGKIFTWWDGATIGTLLWSRNNGEHVGTDATGNRYYRTKKPAKSGLYAGRERRWVIPIGANDASRVPSEWHGWLHGNGEGVPESNLPAPRIWETEFVANETGTDKAYMPQGALQRGGQRARATGDYEAWSPDA